jgi:hypothetical protein
MKDPAKHAPEPDRVRANTSPGVNQRLDREARERVAGAANWDEPALSRRIGALDAEWDVERVIQVHASLVGMVGLALGVFRRPRFLVTPGGAASMLLLHATQGWYPLLPLLRRAGFRTRDEIERERYALKALRGDFRPMLDGNGNDNRRAAAAWGAVSRD